MFKRHFLRPIALNALWFALSPSVAHSSPLDRARFNAGDPQAHLDSPYVHDGFYARADAAFGKGFTSLQSASGFYKQASLRIGGSPVPGVVVGGGLVAGVLLVSDATTGPNDLPLGSVFVGELQLFSSYYPFPQRGLYLTGSIGRGQISFNDSDSNYPSGAAVLGAGIGYDFWIARQWSLGPALGISHIMAHTYKWSDVTSTVTLPLLTIGVTYQ